jgi:LacI family transcriptional regulator, gluconate utilization system Gnt-I transcriptional repressor
MRQGRARAADALRMEDVAAHAGVSPMTVSRALRDPASVSQRMRERVQAAVEDTGYVPNHLAGSLSSQRSQVIGLILPGINNSLYASMAEAIAGVLREHGFHLLIAASDHDLAAEEAAIAAFLSQRVCGLILHSTQHTPRARLLIRTAGVPTVEIGRLTHKPLDLCVSSSGFAAVKAMVVYLGGLGYRRIGFVSLPLLNNERSVERRRGYHAGLKALGIASLGLTVEANPGFAGGVDALLRVVEQDPAIEAILFAADVMAVGALFECHRRGWKVPEEIAIASFDDVDLLSHTVPTVTSLRIPREEIGRRGAAMLVARLQGDFSGPRIVDLKFDIVPRESTARADGKPRPSTVRARSKGSTAR